MKQLGFSSLHQVVGSSEVEIGKGIIVYPQPHALTRLYIVYQDIFCIHVMYMKVHILQPFSQKLFNIDVMHQAMVFNNKDLAPIIICKLVKITYPLFNNFRGFAILL